MFSRSGYSHAISAEIGNIDQRLRALERQLERAGGRSAANAAQAAERRRLSNEVEHRPLVTLAVAIGVGILVGLASHHRSSPQRPPQRRRR